MSDTMLYASFSQVGVGTIVSSTSMTRKSLNFYSYSLLFHVLPLPSWLDVGVGRGEG